MSEKVVAPYGNQASESTQLRVTRLFFLSLLSRKFDDRLSSNFHRFVILCICWDTPTVNKTSLWQLPIVSTVFNVVRQIEETFVWRLPSCPLVIALVPWNAQLENLQLPKGENASVPLPFQKRSNQAWSQIANLAILTPH